MTTPFPWTDDDLAHRVIAEAKNVASLPTFAHHLAKFAVERWFAFELAAALDRVLRPNDWCCVVEGGATTGLGNIDLLLVPTSATREGSRLRVTNDPWPGAAIAIELKAAHLGDGDAGYRKALLQDLTEKPDQAAAAGRPCARWLGLLITTDGLWAGSPNAKATAERADELRLRRLRPSPPLFVESSATISDLHYRGWSGTVWLDAMSEFTGHRPAAEEIRVAAPETTDLGAIFEYALQGRNGTVPGYDYARAHLGITAAELANARLDAHARTGEWTGTYEELRICLYFEQRRWRHFGEHPNGDAARAIQSLFAAIRSRESTES